MAKKPLVSSPEDIPMPEPKLGDQIVPLPGTPIVTDPTTPATTPSGLIIPPEPPIAPDPLMVRDVESSILLEDGTWRSLGYVRKSRDFRVRTQDGRYYEHVADAPDGEWIYRQST